MGNPRLHAFSLLCHTHTHTRARPSVCVPLHPLILMHWLILGHFHFRWERTREELYYPTINYFTFSHIRWTSSSSLLTFLSNCTFLCCHQLWGRLNEFKESFNKICLISSGPFCKAFIAPTDDTEILANLKLWLVSVFIPSWMSFSVPQLVTQPASANCVRACPPSAWTACMYVAWVMRAEVCVSRCVCLLLPRRKACRAPVTWYVGRDRNSGMTA